MPNIAVDNEETQVTEADSTHPKAIYTVPEGSSITAYPTAAGTATVYVSTSPQSDCVDDVVAKNFSTGSAKWQTWSSVAVSTITSEVVFANLSAVAIVPASGTWTLEIVKTPQE